MQIANKIVEHDGKKFELELDYDECCESPREYSWWTKFCFRWHRRMSFPNELDFDFYVYDTGDEEDPRFVEQKELLSKGHVFWIDCYEHGGFAFSLAWAGMQCQFDTSRGCGFVFVEEEKDYEKAKAMAVWQLDDYEAYVNGECYRLDVSEVIPLYDKDGNESGKYNTEYLGTYSFLRDDYESSVPDWTLAAMKKMS